MALVPIRIFRCATCGAPSAICRDYCRECHGEDLREASEGSAAKVISWTVIRRPPAAYAQQGSYLLLVAELASGLRITGRLVEQCEPSAGIEIGHFVDYRGCEQGIHRFAPREV